MSVTSPSSFIKTWRLPSKPSYTTATTQQSEIVILTISSCSLCSRWKVQNMLKFSLNKTFRWDNNKEDDVAKACSVVRLKGEENTVMQDYVLPDFSTIKKGFCKVSEHIWTVMTERRLCAALTAPFLCLSLKRRWSSVGSTKPGSRSWGWPTSVSLSPRCSSTRLTSASRRWESQRPSWTPSSPYQKVCCFSSCLPSAVEGQHAY